MAGGPTSWIDSWGTNIFRNFIDHFEWSTKLVWKYWSPEKLCWKQVYLDSYICSCWWCSIVRYSVLQIYRNHIWRSHERLAHKGEIWGVILECKVWPKLYHYNSCSVRITVVRLAVICRESTVLGKVSVHYASADLSCTKWIDFKLCRCYDHKPSLNWFSKCVL